MSEPNSGGINIRRETTADYKAVEVVTREAFWNHHGPGCDEHYLVYTMRNVDAFVEELDLVAEKGGQIVGNIMYTRAKIICDDSSEKEVLTFGPISVLPECQRQGIGTLLINESKKLAAQMGFKAILIYGDPDYYCCHGFIPAESFGIGTSDNMYAAALLACELREGALKECGGRFVEDKVYNVDSQAADIFDESFPLQEKCEDSPSQRRFRELVTMRRIRSEMKKG